MNWNKLAIKALLGFCVGFTIAHLLIDYARADEDTLYCYAPYGKQPFSEFEASVAVIRINWVEGPPGTEARSEFVYDAATGISVCEVWIRMPDNILGDPDMDGIGHESLHCFIGDFHK